MYLYTFFQINVSMAPMCKIFNIPLIIMESICYIDLYLMLHVAFYGPKNQLISHPYLTAKNYLQVHALFNNFQVRYGYFNAGRPNRLILFQGAFIIDFLTCCPWYAFWLLFVPKHNEGHSSEDHRVNAHMFHCIIRMVNVLQIYKLYSAFWTESISALKRVRINIPCIGMTVCLLSEFC